MNSCGKDKALQKPQDQAARESGTEGEDSASLSSLAFLPVKGFEDDAVGLLRRGRACSEAGRDMERQRCRLPALGPWKASNSSVQCALPAELCEAT